MPPSGPELWRQSFPSSNFRGFTRLGDIDGLATPCPIPAFEPRCNGHYFKHSKRRMESDRQGPPFAKAASGLSHALHFARKNCKGILERFNKEVLRSTIASWTPPHIIDMLWTVRLEWNGVDLCELENNPKTQRSPDSCTYNDAIADLFSAIRDFRMCQRPRQEDLEATEFGLEVIKNTTKKLDVTLAVVEGLMQAVKKDWKLMQPLMKEMLAASDLLTEMKEIWSPSGKYRKENWRAKWDEAENDGGDEDDEDGHWRNYCSD